MHSNLDRFEGAETDVGKEFSGSRGTQEQDGLVLGGSLFTSKSGIQVLEVFVETILAGALNGITDESWTPTREDTANTLGSVDLAPSIHITFVQRRVDLSAALDQIQGSDSSVCGALRMCQQWLDGVEEQPTQARIPLNVHAA